MLCGADWQPGGRSVPLPHAHAGKICSSPPGCCGSPAPRWARSPGPRRVHRPAALPARCWWCAPGCCRPAGVRAGHGRAWHGAPGTARGRRQNGSSEKQGGSSTVESAHCIASACPPDWRACCLFSQASINHRPATPPRPSPALPTLPCPPCTLPYPAHPPASPSWRSLSCPPPTPR